MSIEPTCKRVKCVLWVLHTNKIKECHLSKTKQPIWIALEFSHKVTTHPAYMCEVRAATSHQFNRCYDVQNDSNWIAVDRKHTIVWQIYLAQNVENTAFYFLPPTECWLHLNSHASFIRSIVHTNKDHGTRKGLASPRTLSNVISIFVRQVAEAFKWNCVSSKSIASLNSFTPRLHTFTLSFFFFFFALLNASV